MTNKDWYKIDLAPTDRKVIARNLGGEEKKVSFRGSREGGNWIDENGSHFNPLEWNEAPPEPKVIKNTLLNEKVVDNDSYKWYS